MTTTRYAVAHAREMTAADHHLRRPVFRLYPIPQSSRWRRRHFAMSHRFTCVQVARSYKVRETVSCANRLERVRLMCPPSPFLVSWVFVRGVRSLVLSTSRLWFFNRSRNTSRPQDTVLSIMNSSVPSTGYLSSADMGTASTAHTTPVESLKSYASAYVHPTLGTIQYVNQPSAAQLVGSLGFIPSAKKLETDAEKMAEERRKQRYANDLIG